MKKITSLLMLLCMSIGMAWAQSYNRPVVSTAETVYEYYIQNARNSAYFVTTTTGLSGSAQQLGTANEFTESKAKVTFKLTEGGKLYSTNVGETPLIVGYTSTAEGANSVQLFAEGDYTWNVEAASLGVTLSAGESNNSWNMFGGAGANVGLYRKSDGGSNWNFVPANAAAQAKYDEAKAAYISTEYFYQFKNVKHSRMLSSNETKATVTSTNSTADFYQLWKLEEASNGKYYLKNAGSGKYLNYATSNNTTWDVSETPKEFSFRFLKDFAGENPAVYAIQYDESDNYACAHDADWGQAEQVVRWDLGADASQWYAMKTNISVNALPVSFTYSFIYGGVEKYTQDCTGFVGDVYPEVTVALPYGISATKPAGELTQDVNGTVVEVELTENLSFVYAADYASVNNWYYLKFHATAQNPLYYPGDDSVLLTDKTAVDASNIEAYTWGFVGNPFDGFKIVNRLAGNGKAIVATENGAVVSDGADNVMYLTSSPHGTNGFYMQATTGSKTDRFNKQGGKVVYWTGADAGSTFMVEERDLTGRTELQALVDAVEAAAPNYVVGEGIGYHTQASVDAVVAAVAAAKAALAGEMTAAISAQHQTAINNAVAALAVNMPTPGALYRIKNVFRGRFVSVDATGKRVPSEENNANASLIWTVEKKGDVYTIKNLNYGDNGYMKVVTDNQLTNAQEAAGYSLVPFGEGQFKLTNSGNNFVDYGGNKGLGAWGSADKGGDGAWYFIPATELEVEVADEYGSIHLPFDVTLAEGDKAYAVTATSETSATLAEKKDIPAGEGAILAQGTYTLNIAKATSDWEDNKLEGSNVNTYVEGNAYVLAKKDDVIGFYKAELNFAKNGEEPWAKVEENGTHFLNNANKAYLPAPTAATARFISFDFGTETAIDELNGENGNEKTVIYDLSGRRVQKAQKGIFIVNGKKVIK